MRNVKQIGGYLLVFVIFMIPGIIALMNEGSANTVGMYYVGTLIWSVLAWGAYLSLPGDRVKGYTLLALAILMPAGSALVYGAGTVQAVLYLVATIALTGLAWVGLRLVVTSERIV